MREALKLPKGYHGAIWKYQASGAHRRRAHRHIELELNLVVQGTAKYLVGERSYDLVPGTLIWLFPDDDHLLLDESKNYSMWIVVVRPEQLRMVCHSLQSKPLLESTSENVLARTLRPRQVHRIAALFAEIADAGNDSDRFNAGLSYALLLTWEAFKKSEFAALGSDVHTAVEKAARLLRDETDLQNFDVLADRCGLSRSRLSRLFREQVGVTLVEYRQRQCIDRFLNLYGSGTRKTMLDTALQAGFGSYASFHRVFKQQINKGPADFRKTL